MIHPFKGEILRRRTDDIWLKLSVEIYYGNLDPLEKHSLVCNTKTEKVIIHHVDITVKTLGVKLCWLLGTLRSRHKIISVYIPKYT